MAMNGNLTKKVVETILWQSAALLAISVAISLGVNAVRPNGIALVGDWSKEARLSTPEGGNLAITLENAKSLYDADAAVFLDARPRGQFMDGHIEGAKSLPWLSFDEYFDQVMPEVPQEKTIITYCDGAACTLSTDLARALIDFGFSDVRVLGNGWHLWKVNGYPVGKGDEVGG